MQESVNEQRPDKIFADAKEVEITRAIAKEFLMFYKIEQKVIS